MTMRVPIQLVRISESLRTSQKKKHVVTYNLTVDNYLSACIVREVISEKRNDVILSIPLEIIKEIRERTSNNAKELVLVYGMEFNLKQLEFQSTIAIQIRVKF